METINENEEDLLKAFRSLPVERQADALTVVKDLKRPAAAAAYRYLSTDESLLIAYYRRLNSDNKADLKEHEQELLDMQEDLKAWRQTFQKTAPELLDWSSDIAANYDGSFLDRMLAINRLEEQINLRLPAGVWFSTETAFPVTRDIYGNVVDYDMPAEEWHEICKWSNTAVIEAAQRDYERRERAEDGEEVPEF